ncbi:hypothetical protein [Lysinibacillus xylanilyticus]
MEIRDPAAKRMFSVRKRSVSDIVLSARKLSVSDKAQIGTEINWTLW